MTRHAKPRKGWLAQYSELIGAWRSAGQSKENGEDAMHDTVLGMLKNGVGSIDNPRAYMARGTSNRLISQHRHANVLDITPLDDLAEMEHPVTAGADANAQYQQLAEALAAALEELPLKCRQVYIKHRLEGWTHTEIAEEMGLSRSMIEKYMTRALRHVSERLQHYAPY